MSQRASELDVVRITRDIAGAGLQVGATGTIVHLHAAQPPAYEVEFCDDQGRTVALLTLTDDDMEVFWKFAASHDSSSD